MEFKTDSIVGCVFLVILVVVLVTTALVEYAVVLQTIWNWFLNPLFHIYMPLKNMLGLCLFVELLMYKADAYEEDRDKKDMLTYITNLYFSPLFVLLLAYMVKVW